MEFIRQAVERARERDAGSAVASPRIAPARASAGVAPTIARRTERSAVQAPFIGGGAGRSVELDSAHLEANRIIAHDRDDPRSRAFDVLRTQVLQSMDMRSWRLLAVTSPTAGCGKTLTAVNLALSIARHPERSVMLVDLDLQKPRVAGILGLPGDHGVMDALVGRCDLATAIVNAQIGPYQLPVLACERSVSSSSEWMASRALSGILQDLKNGDAKRIVVIDLPPLLAGDNVMSLLPHIDCTLFVTAVGVSKTAEIKECNKHLQSTSVVRVVVNKAADVSSQYFYY
jgi:Mrp family chromosome partitioning ATPase